MQVPKFSPINPLRPVQLAATAQAAPDSPAAPQQPAPQQPAPRKTILGVPLPSLDPKDYGDIPASLAQSIKDLKGDVSKLSPWEKVLVSTVGVAAGWKVDDYGHAVAQRHAGQQFVDDGQTQYLRLRKEGTDSLVAALSAKHNFIANVKDGDFTGSSWNTFQTYVVRAETGANQTSGTYKGKPNMPVVLIALAENPNADKEALASLAKWLKADLATSPSDIKLYQPVVDALKSVHNVNVQ